MDIRLYQHLNISPNASFLEIQNAYRHLSLRLHPDKTGGNQEITQTFNASLIFLFLKMRHRGK